FYVFPPNELGHVYRIDENDTRQYALIDSKGIYLFDFNEEGYIYCKDRDGNEYREDRNGMREYAYQHEEKYLDDEMVDKCCACWRRERYQCNICEYHRYA